MKNDNIEAALLKSNIHLTVSQVNHELFEYSLRYIDELHNKIFGGRFGKDDFERLQTLYDLKKLQSNLDLEDLNEKVEGLIVDVTQEKVDELQKESAELLESYTTHYQSVFLVDGIAYASIASDKALL